MPYLVQKGPRPRKEECTRIYPIKLLLTCRPKGMSARAALSPPGGEQDGRAALNPPGGRQHGSGRPQPPSSSGQDGPGRPQPAPSGRQDDSRRPQPAKWQTRRLGPPSVRPAADKTARAALSPPSGAQDGLGRPQPPPSGGQNGLDRPQPPPSDPITNWNSLSLILWFLKSLQLYCREPIKSTNDSTLKSTRSSLLLLSLANTFSN